MTTKTPGLSRLQVTILTVATAIAAAHPARAQDTPGAAAATLPAPAYGPALSTATPMTDLLTRMDALETQVARLTAANEELANHQRQIETKLAPAPAPAAAPIPTATDTPGAAAPVASASANTANLAAMTGGASDRGDDSKAEPAHASAKRVAAVKAVIKPQTRDAGLDEYSYGFRLYSAKFYPEAAQQLKLYIDRYPQDAHISHARNLLGRAYLDDGKPREAAPWFLTNYKTDPHGARAADSLLNLGAAMRQLGDDKRACIALHEFADTYAADAQGRLREDYARTQRGLTCS